MARTRYRQDRDAKVGIVTKVQSLARMYIARRRYLDLRQWWKSSAALTIQKYCRGRIGRREFQDYKRFEMVDVLAEMVGSMWHRHELDLNIRLNYAWKKHKIKVAKKKAKAKKKKAAGKGNKYGRKPTGTSTNMNSTLVSQKSTASNFGKTSTSIQSSTKADPAKDATTRQDTIGDSGTQAIQEEDGEPAENEDEDNLSRAEGEQLDNDDEEDPAKKKEDLEKDGYKVQDYQETRLSNANSQELIINIDIDPAKEDQEGGGSPSGLRKTVNFDNSIEQIDGEGEQANEGQPQLTKGESTINPLNIVEGSGTNEEEGKE